MARKKTVKNYVFAVGRRKTSVARVRLFTGKGETLVNGKSAKEYFSGVVGGGELWSRPFDLTQTEGKYWATIKVRGGGKKGQLEAALHGLSRALASLDVEKFRKPLKAAGLLTRDARIRERRKVGMGGKSRRKKQSPKR